MIAHRIPAIITVTALSVLVALYSIVLLQSTDLAMGLFILGLAIALLLVEPFVGLVVYVLFLYTGPQAYVPALENLRVVFVIGAATLGSMAARRVIRAPETVARGGPQTLLVTWFFIAVLASRLSHLEFAQTVSAGYDVLNLLVLFTLVVRLTTSERKLQQLLGVVLIGTVLLALQGVYQHFIGAEVFSFQEFKKGRVTGIGHFVNPNMLAIGLVCGIPVAFALMARIRNILLKVLIVAALGVILYALYLTNSRSGVLSLCVVAGVAITRRYGILAGLGTIAAAFVLVVQYGPSRMAELSATEASAFGRLLAWDQGYRIFVESPLFGAGAGAWYEKYRTLVAHNSFIHCAAELGLFGLAAWVLLGFVSLKNLWYVAARRDDDRGATTTYAYALLLALVGFLFASFFISKTYHVLYFLLVGLAAATVNIFVGKERGDYQLMSRRDVIVGILLMVVGLVAFRAFLVIVGVGG